MECCLDHLQKSVRAGRNASGRLVHVQSCCAPGINRGLQKQATPRSHWRSDEMRTSASVIFTTRIMQFDVVHAHDVCAAGDAHRDAWQRCLRRADRRAGRGCSR